MAEEDSDRSEEATQHKLDEAHKKGSVAKSTDFSTMAIMATLAVVIYSSGWETFRNSLHLQQKLLSRAGEMNWSSDAVSVWLGDILLEMMSLMGNLFLALVIVAIAINVFQTGPVFSFHPIKPDVDRLNPANGFKRIFSMRTLFDGVKSVLKLLILGTVMYLLIFAIIPGLLGVSALDPRGYAQLLVDLAGSLLFKMVAVLLCIGVLDLVYTRWEYSKRMRMSQRDIRDEHKNREGDPRIRARIRELRKEVLKRTKAMAKMPSADVLITNPTHLAVALCYEHGVSGAPQVIAKGAGDMAATMRFLARKHNIPIVQNKGLARELFREVDFDGYVPEKLYPQVAKIMVWVYAMRRNRSGKAK